MSPVRSTTSYRSGESSWEVTSSTHFSSAIVDIVSWDFWFFCLLTSDIFFWLAPYLYHFLVVFGVPGVVLYMIWWEDSKLLPDTHLFIICPCFHHHTWSSGGGRITYRKVTLLFILSPFIKLGCYPDFEKNKSNILCTRYQLVKHLTQSLTTFRHNSSHLALNTDCLRSFYQKFKVIKDTTGT